MITNSRCHPKYFISLILFDHYISLVGLLFSVFHMKKVRLRKSKLTFSGSRWQCELELGRLISIPCGFLRPVNFVICIFLPEVTLLLPSLKLSPVPLAWVSLQAE